MKVKVINYTGMGLLTGKWCWIRWSVAFALLCSSQKPKLFRESIFSLEMNWVLCCECGYGIDIRGCALAALLYSGFSKQWSVSSLLLVIWSCWGWSHTWSYLAKTLEIRVSRWERIDRRRGNPLLLTSSSFDNLKSGGTVKVNFHFRPHYITHCETTQLSIKS